jgi:ABC-type polysaccharide/polyol phosphate transport system ATPase subunit
VGDDDFQSKCLERISNLKRTEKTIVIVSHDLESMKKITNRIIYLNKGILAV